MLGIILKSIKSCFLVVPFVCVLLVVPVPAELKATFDKGIERMPVINEVLVTGNSLSNNLLVGQSKSKSGRSPINAGFGITYHNWFGVEIDGCYYQVEQSFNGLTGELYCGTVIVFCEDSVEIYTGGPSCS